MHPYLVGHLKAWSEHKLTTDEARYAVPAITAHVDANPELIGRSYSWREILTGIQYACDHETTVGEDYVVCQRCGEIRG